MEKILITTLVAAFVIGCGKEEKAPAKNETGSNLSKAPAKPEKKSSANKLAGNLLEAAGNGDLQAVQAHIATGTDLNQKDPNGSTPLVIAALLGHVEICQMLIAGGADLNLKNNDGSTALMGAAFMCHPEIVKALLAKGADTNIRINTGTTAGEVAGLPWEAVKPFYDFLNRLIFQPMGKPVDYDRIQKTRPEIAKILRDKGGKAGAPGGAGAGILQEAVFSEDLAAVKKLIAAGANVNEVKPDDGGTPLHTAVFVCNIEIVKALIAAKADVNAKNKKGETPIFTATLPWENIKPAYDFLGNLAQKKFDLERIEKDRVKVAEILRTAGAK
jgi:ankyrin repeat protein